MKGKYLDQKIIKKTSRIIFPEVQNYSVLPTTNEIDLVNVAILILFAVTVQEMFLTLVVGIQGEELLVISVLCPSGFANANFG